ncbi:hypothetical protein C9374_008754 [Naegleria lovaniensis]|uniref:sn-1-specific diacylglycerol lipase n=1 Tax=Naegleria lovaniensis TaxID=51637 RepID=A0AA88KF94_NAELO|nr:uncharacterized protein C9374_008754 [Naegleria lovaniensis]KAG2378132.1 hypothetical protein C9374_008754 [Naegleria lovaniensis]
MSHTVSNNNHKEEQQHHQSSLSDHHDANYLKHGVPNLSEGKAHSKHSSYKEMITATATCLKDSFPSYKHLTIGDIVFGLSCLANEHSKSDVIGEEMRNPMLYNRSDEEETDEEYKWWHEHSNIDSKHHDHHSLTEQLIFAKRMMYYANLAYYNVANESERGKVQKALLEGYESLNQGWFSSSSSPQPKYTKNSLKYLESLRYETNLLFYVNISEANQQAFFVKMDHDLKAVVIAIRGTSQLADIFTNLSAENSDLKVHRFYGDYKRNPEKKNHLIDTADMSFDLENNNSEDFCESDDNEQMIHGKVHAGYINTARWILSKIQDFLLKNIFNHSSTYKSYRIITVGHSLGGGLAAVLAILLRETFFRRYKEHFASLKCNHSLSQEREPPHLPDIEAITYAPSAIFSENLSNWCRSFVTSYIIAGDIVPRISLGQVEKLRLEVNETNWEEKLKKFFDEHSKIANVAVTMDSYLVEWGFSPLFQTKKTLITSSSKANLSVEQLPTVDVPVSTATITSTIIDSNSNKEQSTATDSQNGEQILSTAEAVTKQLTNEAIELLEEMNAVNEQIHTLYPPGSLYFIIPDSEKQRNKDVTETLFEMFNDQLFSEKKVKEAKEETGVVSSIFSTVKTIYQTVRKSYEESNENGSLVSEDHLLDMKNFIHSQTPSIISNNLNYTIQRVDMYQFGRIVLSRFMFSHHYLVGFKTALDCLLCQTQANPKLSEK